MAEDCYFGMYARFETTSKKDAAILLGSDCIVGEYLEVQFRPHEGLTRAWLANPYGSDIGYLDQATSNRLNVLAVRGWTLKAMLAFAAYTDEPEPGHYWGQVALICYAPNYDEAFLLFADTVSKMLGRGIRPRIDLSTQAVHSVIESKGTWEPSDRSPLPEKNKHTVILKKQCSFMDGMVQQGRAGNKGCYAISWVFLLAMVAAILFGLKSCGVF